MYVFMYMCVSTREIDKCWPFSAMVQKCVAMAICIFVSKGNENPRRCMQLKMGFTCTKANSKRWQPSQMVTGTTLIEPPLVLP